MDSVEAEPWRLAYKVVSKRIGGKSAGTEAAIIEGLFSVTPPPNWMRNPLWSEGGQANPDPFTVDELQVAAMKLPAGKSPGPDGVLNEVLAAVVRWNPAPLLRAFNGCLGFGTFPPEWKRARIVLLHKEPSKPVDQPSSFRPISLLDGAGTILERLVLNRVAR